MTAARGEAAPEPVSARLERRIRRDFPAGTAEEILRRLKKNLPDEMGSTVYYYGEHRWAERVQAAIILTAAGDFAEFEQAYRLAITDWRDILMAADLAHAYWPCRLDDELGTDGAPD